MKLLIVLVFCLIQFPKLFAQNISEDNTTINNDSTSRTLKLRSIEPFKNNFYNDTLSFFIYADVINIGDTVVFKLYNGDVLMFNKEFISEYQLYFGSEIKIVNNQLIIVKFAADYQVYCPSCPIPITNAAKHKRITIIKNLYRPFCRLVPHITTSYLKWNLNAWFIYVNKNDIPLITKKTIGTPIYPSQSTVNSNSESSLNNLNLVPVSQTFNLKPTTYNIRLIQTTSGYQEIYSLY